MALTLPAGADTRDDVLAGVARCGVIHDDRVWLDCVYGAQQPMRARLGLTPAPELQQRLVPGANVAPPPRIATPTTAAATSCTRLRGRFGNAGMSTGSSRSASPAAARGTSARWRGAS